MQIKLRWEYQIPNMWQLMCGNALVGQMVVDEPDEKTGTIWHASGDALTSLDSESYTLEDQSARYAKRKIEATAVEFFQECFDTDLEECEIIIDDKELDELLDTNPNEVNNDDAELE